MTKYDIDVNDKDQIKNALNKNVIKRNRYLNVVLKYLNELDQNTIIALDGDCGSGKTVFLKELEYLVNDEINNEEYVDNSILDIVENNYVTFYFNAWENDDSPNVLSSIILSLIQKYNLDKNEKAIELVKKILNISIKTATLLYFGKAVDVSKLSKNVIEENDILTATKELENEKQLFNDFISELLKGKQKDRILIIIDEIDRCKPEFAINILETIKHLFTDKRITFLIGTNNKELGHVICKVYGDDYDGYGYLDKFFDYQFSLPSNYLDLYTEYLFKEKDKEYYENMIPLLLIKKYKLTMREANRYYSLIDSIDSFFGKSMTPLTIDYTYFSKFVFAPLALILKVKPKQDYYKFIDGKMSELMKIFTEEYFSDAMFNIFSNSKVLCSRIQIIENDTTMSDEQKEKQEDKELEKFLTNMYNISFKKSNNQNLNFKIQELIDVISMQGGVTI